MQELQDEGVASFVKSFENLTAALVKSIKRLHPQTVNRQRRVGPSEPTKEKQNRIGALLIGMALIYLILFIFK